MREYQKVGETLAALDPAKREYQLERAYGHGNIAHMLERQRAARGALQHHRAALRIKEALARSAPDDLAAQGDLAVAYNKVGVVLFRLGELRESLRYFDREHAMYRR